MLIKVCGLRDNFFQVAALKPDFAGMIFYEKSPRYVLKNSSEELKQKIPGIKKTGVFVNENIEKIFQFAYEFNLDFVQLHGIETPEFCAQIRKKNPVIKAFGISCENDFSKIKPYENCVDYFLFDTKTEKYGGSGEKFSWEVFNKVKINKKFFLSGGIGLEDILMVKNLKINNLVGIDLNSRFEISPALKNVELLKKAFEILSA